jgi:hypothetical protein
MQLTIIFYFIADFIILNRLLVDVILKNCPSEAVGHEKICHSLHATVNAERIDEGRVPAECVSQPKGHVSILFSVKKNTHTCILDHYLSKEKF